MRKITKQQLANNAANTWKQHYCFNNTWKYGNDKKSIYKKLVKLGNTPTPESIDLVIGNNSWTRLKCNECNEEQTSVIELGELPDYESRTAHICAKCLNKAIKLI